MNIKVDANTVGVALLVSNDYTTLKTESSLPFTHRDADNLAQLFKEFTYAVYRRKNVSAAEFVTCYKALAEFKYPPTCKRTLVYFSGHGKDGALMMQDGEEVKIEDMISCFKIHVANNSTLAGVVKMFFVDACRGSQGDDGYYMKAMRDDEITCLKRVPKEGNTLVAYASTRYHVSFGDATGSQWTNCLIKALRESKESDDVCTILISANKMLRKIPNQHGFQTAEFTANLADYVLFKQEAIKLRNILVIGEIGYGKSSLINYIIGKDYLPKAKHFHREFLIINNNRYQCDFLEFHTTCYRHYEDPISCSGDCLDEMEDQSEDEDEMTDEIEDEIIDPVEDNGLNLIMYVIRDGYIITEESRKRFKACTKLYPKSISALVVTHCEYHDDARRTRIDNSKSNELSKDKARADLIKKVRSNEQTRDIAASMGKGVYTVGFPDFDDDVIELHQLIEKSNDTVDYEKYLETQFAPICSIM